MKNRKRLLTLALLCMAVAVSVLGLTACGNKVDNRDPQIVAVYNAYVANANEKGSTPLSYEEWLKSIKGEKGDKGDPGQNGEKGDKGDKGQDGKDGKTPVITIGSNGNWYVDGVDTGVLAKGQDGKDGEKGDKGNPGKSAYEMFKERYGYEGTEEQWLYDLVNGNLTLKETHTVTFDSNGGSSVASQTIQDGKKASEPDIPVKQGYTFNGWYVKTTEWNFLAYVVTDDVTLTAKWTANKYVVSFDANGGNSVADLTVTYNEPYTLPTPVKSGYTFLEWDYNGNDFERNGTWTLTSNISLTAEWVISESVITFVTGNGETLSPLTVIYGSNYTLPKITKDGFILVGWFNGETKYEDNALLTGNITLTAKWEGANEAFMYSLDGETATITAYRGSAKDVVIPKTLGEATVTAILQNVFSDNTDITSVTFNGGFENYNEKMFAGCTSLKSLTLSGTYAHPLYWLFGKDISSVPVSLTELSFAADSLYFSDEVFKSPLANQVITYVIPYGVTTITNNQFSDCYLKSIVIPDSVTSIDNDAFSGCSSLTSVTIGNGVTSIGDRAFYYCTSLTSVTIPNSVTSISEYAFYNCTSLTSVTIPDSVTSIGDRAFSYCDSLNAVYITDISAWCNISFYDNPLSYAHNLYLNGELVAALVIPDSVKSIGNFAFEGCTSLTSVTIPDSVTSINSAFKGCTSLTSITIPDGVTSIDGAFSGCTSLINVTIPDSVTSIGDYAFYNCISITNITIPDSVAVIGNYAFSGCTSLTAITIPDSVTNIESYAYSGCYSLTSVSIGKKVTIIGKCSFYGCSSLVKITLPKSLKSIGIGVFSKCSPKLEVYYNGTIAEWNEFGKDAYLIDSNDYYYYIHCNDGVAYKKYWTDPY